MPISNCATRAGDPPYSAGLLTSGRTAATVDNGQATHERELAPSRHVITNLITLDLAWTSLRSIKQPRLTPAFAPTNNPKSCAPRRFCSHGQPNSRRCHGQVGSPMLTPPPGPSLTIYTFTAARGFPNWVCSLSTCSRHSAANPRSSRQVSPAMTPPPSSSRPQLRPKALLAAAVVRAPAAQP